MTTPTRSRAWTAAEVRAHSDRAFAVLVDLWQKMGGLDPIGILYLPEQETVAVPMDALPKHALKAALQGLAAKVGASHIAFAAEASVVETDDPVAMEAWQASGRSIHEHPDAVDCLFLTVDGPGISTAMRAWQKPGENVSVEVMDGPMSGSMANLSGRLGEN